MTHPHGDPVSEGDLQLAQPDATVKVSTLVQGLAGVVIALAGLQVAHIEFRSAAIDLVPTFLMGAGVLHLVLAVQVYRARPKAALVSAILGPGLAVSMVGWVAFSFWAQIFSCMTVVAAAISVLSAPLTILALKPVRRTAEARQRMTDQGMNLGF